MAANRMPGKRRTAKRRTAKRRTAKRRTAKRRTAKRRTAKRRTAKRRTAKRRTAKRRTAKRRTAKRSAFRRPQPGGMRFALPSDPIRRHARRRPAPLSNPSFRRDGAWHRPAQTPHAAHEPSHPPTPCRRARAAGARRGVCPGKLQSHPAGRGRPRAGPDLPQFHPYAAGAFPAGRPRRRDESGHRLDGTSRPHALRIRSPRAVPAGRRRRGAVLRGPLDQAGQPGAPVVYPSGHPARRPHQPEWPGNRRRDAAPSRAARGDAGSHQFTPGWLTDPAVHRKSRWRCGNGRCGTRRIG